MSAPVADGVVNEVSLSGRVAGTQERVLPSGDVIVTFRVVVDREPRRGSSVKVDALDCVTWRADLRRRALTLADGDEVLVDGALRRRFWRGGAGAASRVEVEVLRLRRVRR